MFISHEATRTGAPIVLLHLLRWLRANTELSIATITYRGGALESEFASFGPHRSLDIDRETPLARLTRRLGEHDPAEAASWLSKRGRPERVVRALAMDQTRRYFERAIRSLGPADLYYANSSGSAPVVRYLSDDVPVIAHIHELDYQLLHTEERSDTLRMVRRPNRLVACSGAVAKALIEYLHAPRERVDVCYEFVPTHSQRVPAAAVDAAYESLGIPSDAVVIGGVGTPDWRKGTDVFVRVAALVQRLHPNKQVVFVWVGGDEAWPTYWQMRHDISHCDLQDSVKLIPHIADPRPYFQRFDIFLLTSRSDPFPLVCLEAAAMGTPIVCFDDAGGMPEFVEDDCGIIVPYLDEEGMAGALIDLVADARRRTLLGSRARTKVQERHDVSIGAPKVLAVIEECLA